MRGVGKRGGGGGGGEGAGRMDKARPHLKQARVRYVTQSRTYSVLDRKMNDSIALVIPFLSRCLECTADGFAKNRQREILLLIAKCTRR